MLLQTALKSISAPGRELADMVQKRLDSLTKPIGSLGRLEHIVRQIAVITGNFYPNVDKKAIIIMCSDNGVTDEGVSSCPRSVTASVTRNFMRGITGINVFARHTGADLFVVDVGVDDDICDAGVINKKIRRSTWNIARGPAMTREEAIRSIETGIDIVEELKNKGYNLLGTGEMGIANTTTSSAVASVLTGLPVEIMVGKGAGLSADGLENKKSTVTRAIQFNNPDPSDPIDVLAKLGGFDIGGLAGCFIGAACCKLPILIDGFISAAAALVAVRIEPRVIDYIFPSHGSAEPGSKKIMQYLGLEPYLNLEMRLGEGTGAALAFHIIDAAIAAYTGMGTFGDACIEQYTPQE